MGYIEICVFFVLFSLRFRVRSNPNTEDVIHIPLIRIQLISVSEHMLICHFIEKVKCIFYVTCPLLCILSQRSLIRESLNDVSVVSVMRFQYDHCLFLCCVLVCLCLSRIDLRCLIGCKCNFVCVCSLVACQGESLCQ